MGDKKKKLVYSILARNSGPRGQWVSIDTLQYDYSQKRGLTTSRKTWHKIRSEVRGYLNDLVKDGKAKGTEDQWHYRLEVKKLTRKSFSGWNKFRKNSSWAWIGESLGKFDIDDFSDKVEAVWEANNRKDFSFEERMWERTLENPPPGQEYLLKKLFAILKYGRLLYRYSEGGNFEPWPHSLAAALSHGGRILIQLPPWKEGVSKKERMKDWIYRDPFMKWFLQKESYVKGGKRKMKWVSMTSRTATHSIHPAPGTVVKAKKLVSLKEVSFEIDSGYTQGEKWLIEQKGNWGPMEHYGIDLALGGTQSPSPYAKYWDGDWTRKDPGPGAAKPNGRHGHMYLGYLSPQLVESLTSKKADPIWQRMRGLLIGIEGSRPLLRDVGGHYHGPGGKSSIMKISGGIKWTFLDITEKPGEYDCMFVDLSLPYYRKEILDNWEDIKPRDVRGKTKAGLELEIPFKIKPPSPETSKGGVDLLELKVWTCPKCGQNFDRPGEHPNCSYRYQS